MLHPPQKEAEKQKEVDRMKQLMTAAEEHHQRAILKYSGWRPWRKYVANLDDQLKTADKFYGRNLLRFSLLDPLKLYFFVIQMAIFAVQLSYC